jgi:hypothetical protein
MSCWNFISLRYQFCLQAVPFLAIFAGGYFYVGFNSLLVLRRMAHDSAEPELAPAVKAVVEPVSS